MASSGQTSLPPDPMAKLEAAVLQPDPMAQLEAVALQSLPHVELEEAAAVASQPSAQSKAVAVERDPMAQLEVAASQQAAALSEDQQALHVVPTPIVTVERLRVPVLAARPASSPSPSSSAEPPAGAARARAAAAGRERLQREAARGAEAHVGPLERYLLRSGEILESYSVRSKVLGHRPTGS